MSEIFIAFIMFAVTYILVAFTLVFMFSFISGHRKREETSTRSLELEADELFSEMGLSNDSHSR